MHFKLEPTVLLSPGLRLQVITIVVGTVAAVSTMSQWLDTRFTGHALERDLHERAQLVLRTAGSLWGQTEPDRLRQLLATLDEGDREVEAIDIYRLDGTAPELAATTRPDGHEADGMLTAEQLTQLRAGVPITTSLRRLNGAMGWRMAVPLHREGGLMGAAQVDVWPTGVEELQQRLRIIDGVSLVSSIGLTSLLLGLFLERRVTRPVAALVAGMQRAERGEFHVRVDGGAGKELAFLAQSFNSMLTQIQDLTAGLEARVQRATEALADKNRELLAVNDELWHAQQEIGRTERLAALGQMAGTIAHELGTPLNSILGYTQLLLREDLSPEHVERLKIVESQVQRMIETIRSVLDRTRDRALRREPVAIGPLVEHALALVSTHLAERRLVARNDVPANVPPVLGDAVGLRQALLNLLTNAIDATDPAGTITVTASLFDGNGDARRYVDITVRDTGHGMSPDGLRRAFEPFYTTKEQGRGTGLGLVIVDHIVRAHGGRLLVQSTPGEGTTMCMRLPLEV